MVINRFGCESIFTAKPARRRATAHPVHQPDAALFELDQRYLEAPAPDPVVVLGLLTDHAFMDRTPHKVHVLMHRDVEIVDHRAIGWGSTVGREAVRDRFDSITDLPEGFAYYMPRLVRSSA